jgi:ribosome-associated protein
MSKKYEESLVLIQSIVEGIFAKNGEKVLKLDMRTLENSVCEYFIICHAGSKPQVDSIAESLELTVKKKLGERPIHKEGLENCFWVLYDYGNIVVHIFMEEYRDFYNLEELWADAEIEEMKDN